MGADVTAAAGSSDDPQPASTAQAAIKQRGRVMFMQKLHHIEGS
ncbi:MAG TPA: hypothetical protein VN818_01725 [Gammaproteobacteria bacterium]|nr:hypothetical protein [Gammaproteobacteria bacterium]